MYHEIVLHRISPHVMKKLEDNGKEEQFTMMTQKIYIANRLEVPIICGACGKQKSLSVSAIKHFGKALKVKCGCGSHFGVLFENREHYRKETEVFGTCYKAGSEEFLSDITVKNLSKTGIGFDLDSRKLSADSFKPGTVLKVHFTLIGKRRSEIRTQVIVRLLTGKYVGGEFYRPDEHTVKEIGFFLLP